MVYAREFDGQAFEFGVVGVERGTLIMYDAQTRSRWSQLFGEAVEGQMQGRALEKLPSTMTTWARWRALHPDTTVYVKEGAYRGRFSGDSFAAIARRAPGPLVDADWVIGIEGHMQARAYPAYRLARSRVVNDALESADILVWLSEDLATSRIFRREVGDRVLTFTLAAGDRLRDEQTGSLWDPLSGRALEGAMTGQVLTPLISTYSLWFAWQKYRPDTVVWEQD